MKNKNSIAVKQWRLRTKWMMVTSMGSKCVVCGYQKCTRALNFHHLNPKEKEFSFGGIRARPKDWKEIEKELKKCILVCANCHMEIEEGVVDASKFKSTYDSSLIIIEDKTLDRNFGLKKCVVCDDTFRPKNGRQKACTMKCKQYVATIKRNFGKRARKTKIDWPLYSSLMKMISLYGYSETGRKLGVSDNAIRKRLNKIRNKKSSGL